MTPACCARCGRAGVVAIGTTPTKRWFSCGPDGCGHVWSLPWAGLDESEEDR